jgi:hypothetical protein
MQEETFIDDDTVPVETRIYYETSSPLFIILFLSFVICFFLIVSYNLSFDNKGWFPLYWAIVFGVAIIPYQVYMLNKAVKKVPLIIINEQGMQTEDTSFYTWEKITNEGIITEEYHDLELDYLTYEYETGKEKLGITNYDAVIKGYECGKEKLQIGNAKELSHLLKIYRGRFEQQKNKENLQRS